MAEDKSRVSVVSTEVLAKGWATNTRVVIDYTRADGTVQRLKREIHDHGDGATILLYSRARGTVVLVCQFRLPPYLNGDDPFLIETCAGLLDADHPEDAIRREAEEETGYRIGPVDRLWTAYQTPGAVTERLHYFAAEYDPTMRLTAGGGLRDEGEEIEVLELPLTEALAMIADGRIIDAKTVALLHYAAWKGLCG
jgi:nudix-type nucleoside diphosphatase (YffH/AdpP family)